MAKHLHTMFPLLETLILCHTQWLSLCPLDLTFVVTASVQTFFLDPWRLGWLLLIIFCICHFSCLSHPLSCRLLFFSFIKKKYLFIWLHQVLVVACRIFDLCCGMQDHSWDMWDLVPWPEIQPGPPTLGAQNLSHWTIREVPVGSCSIFSSTHSAEHMVGSFLNQWINNRNLTEEFLIVAIFLEYHFSG